MNSFSDDFFADSKLTHLMEEYQKSIPGKLEELDRLIQAVYADPSLETLKPLRFALHKLAGNTGVYGYNEASKVCKEFELKIRQQIEIGSQINSTFLSQIETYFQKVKKELHGNPK